MSIGLRRVHGRRLGVLARHLAAEDETVVTGVDGLFELELPMLKWADIMEHNTVDDLWVVIDGRVWDMTEFIATDHPGGEDIPLEYGGKDASDFWHEMHGHVEADILEDLVAGESWNLGLEHLPTLVGLTADPPPPEAVGEAGRERYISRNWTGNVEWTWTRKGPESFLEPTDVAQLRKSSRSLCVFSRSLKEAAAQRRSAARTTKCACWAAATPSTTSATRWRTAWESA